MSACSACNGDGEVRVSDVDYDPCRACEGTGERLDRDIRWRPIAEFRCLDHSEFLFRDSDGAYLGYFDTESGQFGRYRDRQHEERNATHFAFMAPPEKP